MICYVTLQTQKLHNKNMKPFWRKSIPKLPLDFFHPFYKTRHSPWDYSPTHLHESPHTVQHLTVARLKSLPAQQGSRQYPALLNYRIHPSFQTTYRPAFTRPCRHRVRIMRETGLPARGGLYFSPCQNAEKSRGPQQLWTSLLLRGAWKRTARIGHWRFRAAADVSSCARR